MNDDICDFYLQVSKELCDGKEWCITGIGEPLRRFAALVAAHEREACAKLCEEFDAENPYIGQSRACAFEIRARGEK